VENFTSTGDANLLSLSEDDLRTIRDAMQRLVGRWTLETESGDEGELYARLLAPWSDGRRSAFLLERENDVIILTDNLSDSARCHVMGFPNAALAMETVQRVVSGY
jgi:hypothetical protein